MKATISQNAQQTVKLNNAGSINVKNQIIELDSIMKATMPQVTQQSVKVNNLGGSLTPYAPITLKNQIVELNSIENIADVDEINVTDGATLIYNSSTDKYEIKPLNFSDLSGDIDGGTF